MESWRLLNWIGKPLTNLAEGKKDILSSLVWVHLTIKITNISSNDYLNVSKEFNLSNNDWKFIYNIYVAFAEPKIFLVSDGIF